MQKKKVLVIGWDACEWKVVNELIGKGLMPTLKKFLEEGTSGKIATLEPPLSPMLWTSIATGKRAEVHGITGFTEPDPDPNSKTGIRPVLVTSRKVKAIWNILNQEGYKSNVVGWWPSHPAEPINGCMVSNFYQLAKEKDKTKWGLIDGTIHPEKLITELSPLRVHFNELTGAILKNFIPLADNVDQDKDKGLVHIANTLAQTCSIHNAATYLMEHEPWDFMAVYYDGIDHFSHSAMKFHPPKRDFIDAEKFEIYKDVVTSAYRFHDMMLERLLELAGKETTVMIISDHGFHPDHLRPKFIPHEPSGPTYEHSPYGFFAVKGPGIAENKKIYGGSVIDITPTILTLYDLPVGNDMIGKPLIDIFESTKHPEYIPSWEKVDGNHGMHASNKLRDPFEEQEAMNQLIELGYIDKPDTDKSKNIKTAIDESNYNLARGFVHTFRYEEAIPLLQELCESNKYEPRFSLRLFSCYLQKGMFKESDELLRKIQSSYPDKYIPGLDVSEGLLEMSRNNTIRAKELFEKVLSKTSGSPTTLVYMGQSFYRRYLFKEAEEYYSKALLLDPQNVFAMEGMANVLYKTGRDEQALDMLMELIDNMYYFPWAHALIGEILFKSGYFIEASNAFELAVSMNQKDLRSRKRLVEMYSSQIKNEQRLLVHLTEIKKQVRGEIIIVTGLPRSGTSMIMQMLRKAGIDLLTDNIKVADQFNPHGYFEFSQSQTLSYDKSWLSDAVGKAVKIPPGLIEYLPEYYDYRIIYIKRNFNEILKSCLKTKHGLNDNFLNSFPVRLAETFSVYDKIVNQLIENKPMANIVKLDYNRFFTSKEASVLELVNFLGQGNIQELAEVTDENLYQTKIVNN
ncbi:MAG: alkaline phosphatase family protein [Bacteroidota bacterium]